MNSEKFVTQISKHSGIIHMKKLTEVTWFSHDTYAIAGSGLRNSLSRIHFYTPSQYN